MSDASPDYSGCYFCFLFIKSSQLVDETLITIKIQFIENFFTLKKGFLQNKT